MNKPLAIGLIIFFILVIAAGAIWLAVRPAPEEAAERGPILRFPFGLFGGGEPTEIAPPGVEIGEIPESRLTLLSANPVAGFTIVEDDKRGSMVRWIERQTGHVFESDSQGKNIERISNTTIPKIFDVVWSMSGKRAVLKYFEGENVRTISAEFAATSTKGLILPSNILDIAYAPHRERLLYALPAGAGTRLISADPDNTKQSEVLTTPFQEWLINWPTANIIAFLSRPSGEANGFLFSYDLTQASFSKILGDVPGLETLWSPDGKQILYSAYSSSERLPKLFIYNSAKKEGRDLGLKTLVSKCVFSQTSKEIIYCGIDANMPAGLYPDDRLKGKISAFDTLWKINLENGEKNIVGEEVFPDLGQVRISRDDKFLYFTNYVDSSLWSLKLTDGL